MATFNGTEFKASLTGTPNKTIGDTRTLTVAIQTATIDVSTRDSGGWKEIIGGQRSWTASVSGVVDYTEGANEATIKSLVTLGIARTAIGLLFGNAATGNQNYTGSGIITNVEITAEYESTVEYTAEIEGSGPIVISVTA